MVSICVVLTMRLVPTGHLLFFASDKRTLFSEKRMLCSAERRGEAVVSNVADRLGSLKFNLSSKNCLVEYQAVLFFQAAYGVGKGVNEQRTQRSGTPYGGSWMIGQPEMKFSVAKRIWGVERGRERWAA